MVNDYRNSTPQSVWPYMQTTRRSTGQKSTLRGSEKSQKPRWWSETNSAQIDPETTEEKVYRNTKCDDSSSG